MVHKTARASENLERNTELNKGLWNGAFVCILCWARKESTKSHNYEEIHQFQVVQVQSLHLKVSMSLGFMDYMPSLALSHSSILAKDSYGY